METVDVSGLAPLIAAILGPMVALVLASLGLQHRDNAKLRDHVERSGRENREWRERTDRENREWQERTDRENREWQERSDGKNQERFERLERRFDSLEKTVENNHKEVTTSLNDARERLARVEGYLRIGLPSPPPGDGPAGDAAPTGDEPDEAA